ncbi:hypothetical protein ACHAWF_005873 [Thalassiosira exigua]
MGNCCRSKHQGASVGAGNGDVGRGASNGGRANGNGTMKGEKRVTIREDKNRLMQSPNPGSSEVRSTGSGSAASSGRSSVYFDASDGFGFEMASVRGDSFDDDFETLQIDGQYFFTAKDDPAVSNEAFEGIHLYPPLPTTEPDPVPRSPITVENMETLLHTYQHADDDEEARRKDEDAGVALEKAGIALEHQARRLTLSTKDKSVEFLGESTNQLLKELHVPNVREKGFPGELTEEELEAVKLFRDELQTRNPIYNEIVRSFSVVEKEAYALCRWLRARKFDVEKVFELLDQAKVHYAKAKEHDFYPDLEKALGVSRAVFLSQYPAVFCGNAKNGCPVLYLKLGSIQPDGIKCVVSVDTVDRFFWNDTIHAFPPILQEGRSINPNFVRTENMTIYDLKGVSRSQITSDTFDVIKAGNQVMSSFPETLHCLLIINAPSWFGFVWSVVKKLIDPRTASKIEVFTSSKTGSKRMIELIDNSQIPSCYGGSGPSLAEAAAGTKLPGTNNTMVVMNHLVTFPKKKSEKSHDFQVGDAQIMNVTIYTRCKAGCKATLLRTDTNAVVAEIDVAGETEDEPYSQIIGDVAGPGSFTIKLEANPEPGCFLCLGTTTSS